MQNEMVITGIADARTLELFRGGKGDSMVASGGASRRTGFEGFLGASTVNPGCPIRKKEEYRKRLMENVVMKGKLASNEAHNQQIVKKIQSLTEIRASMSALLQNTDDANSQAFQDKLRELVTNFNKHSASPIDTQAPAP